MIIFLRILFSVILITMITVTVIAAMQESILAIPPAVTSDPWFAATLYDAYFGFYTFYLWVFYRETSSLAKLLWFISITLLGNIAISSYMLLALSKLKKNDGLEKLLLKKHTVQK